MFVVPPLGGIEAEFSRRGGYYEQLGDINITPHEYIHSLFGMKVVQTRISSNTKVLTAQPQANFAGYAAPFVESGVIYNVGQTSPFIVSRPAIPIQESESCLLNPCLSNRYLSNRCR